MALDRWLLVAALAIAHGGCDDSERRAEAHASFAAYRACLTGGPLAEGETFSRRMHRVGLAFPEPSQEWPARCETLGDEAYRATKDEPVLRAALVGYASGMRHDDDAWAAADRLVTVEADSSVERPPAPIQPIEAEEWPVLASSGFGNHGIEIPTTRRPSPSPGRALAWVLRRSAAPSPGRSFGGSPGATSTRCAPATHRASPADRTSKAG